MNSSGLQVCELTSTGRGAVSVLQLRGDLSGIDRSPPLFQAANKRSLQSQTPGRICFGRWGIDHPEDVVACRLSETWAEIHCHGGRAAVSRIIADLTERGAEVEVPAELLSNRLPRIEAEAWRALLLATTERTADRVLEQAQTLLPKTFLRFREQLLKAQRLGGDVAQDALQRLASSVANSLEHAAFARHLTIPWSVVLCGRPNVGKSSLVNTLAGFARSIVSPIAGTTRDVVTTSIVLAGWPIELSDTAGLRLTDDSIETEGVTRARARVAAADLVLLLLDASEPLTEEDRQLLDSLPTALQIRHKADLPAAWQTDEFPAMRSVSSTTGQGIEELCSEIVQRLVPSVPPAGTPLPLTIAIEIALLQLQQSLQQGDLKAALQLVDDWSTKPSPLSVTPR